MHLTELEWGYTAGFIDADGSIILTLRSSGHAFYPIISAGNTRVAPLLFLQQKFGGSFSNLGRQNPKWKVRYQWVICSPKMIETVLTKIIPLLKAKRKQAELLLKWLHTRESRLGKRKHGKDGRYVMGGIPIRERELAIMRQIKELNRRGRHEE